MVGLMILLTHSLINNSQGKFLSQTFSYLLIMNVMILSKFEYSFDFIK